jgi:polyisoprenoid-binding protein YceI
MIKYIIDPSHSTASFSIKHMMIAKVHGGFEKLTGSFSLDPQNLAQSQIEASIDTASINTRENQRDNHLKSADFFDVEKFPSITFKSTELEKKGDRINVVGELTIKGITKKISLEIEGPTAEIKDPWGNTKIGASSTTKINRKDFGLTWNAALEAGGLLVGDEVSITLEVQFVKQV